MREIPAKIRFSEALKNASPTIGLTPSQTTQRRIDMDLAREDGKREVLVYLIEVAQKTDGAEVWRALFAELLEGLDR